LVGVERLTSIDCEYKRLATGTPRQMRVLQHFHELS
jgi:hypothetical protein